MSIPRGTVFTRILSINFDEATVLWGTDFCMDQTTMLPREGHFNVLVADSTLRFRSVVICTAETLSVDELVFERAVLGQTGCPFRRGDSEAGTWRDQVLWGLANEWPDHEALTRRLAEIAALDREGLVAYLRDLDEDESEESLEQWQNAKLARVARYHALKYARRVAQEKTQEEERLARHDREQHEADLRYRQQTLDED
jgi:hypothetical protein